MYITNIGFNNRFTMIMSVFVISLLIGSTGLLLLYCSCSKDSVNAPEDNPIQTYDYIAFTAVFDDLDTPGSYQKKLVIAPGDDRTDYRILTPDTVKCGKPKFTRDKTKILFKNENADVNGNPILMVYDILDSTLMYLENQTQGWNNRVYGNNYVWNYSGTGFYFKTNGSNNLKYYNFENRTVEEYDLGVKADPICQRDSEHIIIFVDDNNSYDFLFQNEVMYFGYYNLDLSDLSFERIGDFRLIGANPSEQTYFNRASGLSWNHSDQRYLYSDINSWDIAVWSIFPSYFMAFTTPGVIEKDPVWGH